MSKVTNRHGQQSGGSEYPPSKSKKKKYQSHNIYRDLKTFVKIFINYWINNQNPEIFVIFASAKDIFDEIKEKKGRTWFNSIAHNSKARDVFQFMLKQDYYDQAVKSLRNKNYKDAANERKKGFYRLIRNRILVLSSAPQFDQEKPEAEKSPQQILQQGQDNELMDGLILLSPSSLFHGANQRDDEIPDNLQPAEPFKGDFEMQSFINQYPLNDMFSF